MGLLRRTGGGGSLPTPDDMPVQSRAYIALGAERGLPLVYRELRAVKVIFSLLVALGV